MQHHRAGGNVAPLRSVYHGLPFDRVVHQRADACADASHTSHPHRGCTRAELVDVAVASTGLEDAHQAPRGEYAHPDRGAIADRVSAPCDLEDVAAWKIAIRSR